ncbi:MAG: carotenoid oxygenase family protein [Deltaproteobacteria bacterium]|nr:carotenoid oxygenase family protein [Deltaproteobacteria bacterium]
MFTRREFFTLAGGCASAAIFSGCAASNLPLKSPDFQSQDYKQFPALALVTSITNEYNYEAIVEGKIPQELRGILYRNGPGLFERAGFRKRCLLDGDGMIQAFRIADGKVYFRNKFVRTAKYVEESQAGRFIYPTWTTQAPGGVLGNFFGGSSKSQAGVRAVVRNGKLYAFDDAMPAYELDAVTLSTVGKTSLGMPHNTTILYSHSKIDSRTGEWLFFGLEFGMTVILHITIFEKNGQLKRHQKFKLPRVVYIHDFFVTNRHIIFNLPSMDINIFEYLSGQKSFLGAMRWEPGIGNLILVLDRLGEEAPFQLGTDACWMWHVLNAYEAGDEIIADYIGYQNPDHILGENPALCAIMEGHRGQYNYPGEIRRYVIHTAKKNIRLEILDKGDYEFPFVNPQFVCRKHRFGYFAKRYKSQVFFTEIARIDMETLKSESYNFGNGVFCSEPVFVPKPNHIYPPDASTEPGWLLTEVYNSGKQKTFMAVFRANQISEGPIAKAYLGHPMPLGLHGFWHSHR